MKVLIVYAHPEPRSFNGAMRDLAVDTLRGAGHEVAVSDLYAMRFHPVVGRGDFTRAHNPDVFKLGIEQGCAEAAGTYAEDIVREHEKLKWCDTLILQCPLFWFSLPAILKGWVDRVMGVGFAYGADACYENGGLRGRRAMLSLTTEGPPSGFGPRGRHGDIELILWPIQNGILRFVGFDVLPPFIAWCPARLSNEERVVYLKEFKERLLEIPETPPIFFHDTGDYTEDNVLRPGIAPRPRFQQAAGAVAARR